jgi:alpha-D-ribose 1-methylphosphonate 5-triphosphate diphosphatase PhnM
LGNKNKEELSFGTITLYMDEQCKEHHSTNITQAVLAIKATTKSFALVSHDDIAIHASQSTFQESRKILHHQEE